MNISEYALLWNQASIKVMDVRRRIMTSGEEARPFHLPAEGFIYFVQGQAELMLGDKEYTVESCYVVHGGKGMCVDIRSVRDPIEFYLILYKATCSRNDSPDAGKSGESAYPFRIQYGFKPSYSLTLSEKVRTMEQKWRKHDRLEAFHVKGLFHQFVYELLHQMRARGPASSPSGPVEQAISYIRDNYASPITVDMIADHVGCTPRHLSRLFRNSRLGRSPLDYLIDCRMSKAMELLLSGNATLREIARASGYQDSYHFSRMFKKYWGASPIAYRSNIEQTPPGPISASPRSDSPIAQLNQPGYIDNDNQNHYIDGGDLLMPKKSGRPTAVAMLIAMTVILTACSGSGANNAPAAEGTSQPTAQTTESGTTTAARTIAHDLGETEVPASPQRVVVLEQGFTQTVAALGIKPVGVADDNKPDRFPQDTLALIEGYTSVGTRSEPNLEVMRMLKPDLIIADTARHTNIYKELAAIAPTIAFKNDNANYTETLAATETIGEALGKGEETAAMLQEHQTKLDQLKSSIDPANSVLIISPGEEGGNLFQVRTTAFFHPSFLVAAGMDYALENDTDSGVEMTIEQLLEIDPDTLIITINEDTSSVLESQKDNPLWQQLKAVSGGRAHEVNHSLWARQRSIPALNNLMEEAAELL